MSRSESGTPLPWEWPCGCITGRRLCPEAVRLWQETGKVLQRSTAAGDFAAYEQACCAFDAHYARQEQCLVTRDTVLAQ